MKIIITIDTSNAAFEERGPEVEAASILEYLASNWRGGGLFDRTLRDINGNIVGEAIIEETV